jgi:polyhydroxybutyrate depolymerase
MEHSVIVESPRALGTRAHPCVAAVAFALVGLMSGCVDIPPVGGGGSGGGSGGVCSGKPGSPGDTHRTITVDGITRTFIVHIPENLDPSRPVPVLFAFHGYLMGDQVMYDLTDFAGVADREGFIAVFPDGAGAAPWDVGQNICGAGVFVDDSNTDDIGFVHAMLDDIEEDHCIERDEVFVSGFSMGAYFTNHIACQEGDLLRGAAAHSGGTYEGDCDAGPVPMMIIHGDLDPVIWPACGSESRDLWVERNGCSTAVDVVEVEGGVCEWSRGCPAGGQVVYCEFDGMLHGWAGVGGSVYGGGTRYESATELIWSFFEEQL